MRALLDLLAKQEMREAAFYYEDCRKRLGEKFLSGVETALGEIARRPMMWYIVDGKFRRCLVQGSTFPYAVAYSIEDDFIYVVAVMYMKRKPDYWRDRN